MDKVLQHRIESHSSMPPMALPLQWPPKPQQALRRTRPVALQEPSTVDGARPIARTLALLLEHLPVRRRVLHAGDLIFEAGMPFHHLYVLSSGSAKLINCAADGRDQVVGLMLRGDWLGLEGIAQGHYGCSAHALEIGEVWALRYDALLSAATAQPQLLMDLHLEMSRNICRGRDALLSRCTLPVAARVAEFLREWAGALAARGLRNDQMIFRLSRAEMGNYLGMTLESVSRALTGLERAQVIRFTEKGRRMFQIADPSALDAFIEAEGTPHSAPLQ